MVFPVTQLVLYLRTSALLWVGLYLCCAFACGLPSFALHALGIGFLACLLSYFRLPPPDAQTSRALLGLDPRFCSAPECHHGATDSWGAARFARKFAPGAVDDNATTSSNSTTRAPEGLESGGGGGGAGASASAGTGAGSCLGDPLGNVAHRAAGLDAPENTLAALRLSRKNGAQCVEFDVSFTKDGVPVVFHDDSLIRVTGEAGFIHELTFEEVSKLDAAATHILKDSYSPERIPKVEDFVDEAVGLGMKMIIDLKTWRTPYETMEFVTNLFASRPELYQKAMVSTFFPHLAYLIRLKDPKIVMGMAWRPHFLSYESWSGFSWKGGDLQDKPRFDALFHHCLAVLGDVLLRWSFHEWLWYFIGLSCVLVHKDVLTKEYLHRWRTRGVRVVAWTVNNSLQHAYLSNFLRVTSMSDTMDKLPLNELLREAAGESAAESALTGEDVERVDMDEGAKLFPEGESHQDGGQGEDGVEEQGEVSQGEEGGGGGGTEEGGEGNTQ